MNHICVRPIKAMNYGRLVWALEVQAPTCAQWHQGNIEKPAKPFEITYLNKNGDNNNSGFGHSWASEDEARQFAIAKQAELLARIKAGEHIDQNVSILAHPAVIIE
jgi:hypothetical protein